MTTDILITSCCKLGAIKRTSIYDQALAGFGMTFYFTVGDKLITQLAFKVNNVKLIAQVPI